MEILRSNGTEDFPIICLFSQFKRFTVGTLLHGGIHLMSTHGDTVQSAVIFSLTVIGTLLDGTFDAAIRAIGFHNDSLLSFDRVRDGIMAPYGRGESWSGHGFSIPAFRKNTRLRPSFF